MLLCGIAAGAALVDDGLGETGRQGRGDRWLFFELHRPGADQYDQGGQNHPHRCLAALQAILRCVLVYRRAGRGPEALGAARRGQDTREVGLGMTPRGNRRINDLIYYAQSGGDLKKSYLEFKRGNNTLFSGSGVHFIGTGNRLQCPPEVEYDDSFGIVLRVRMPEGAQENRIISKLADVIAGSSSK